MQTFPISCAVFLVFFVAAWAGTTYLIKDVSTRSVARFTSLVLIAAFWMAYACAYMMQLNTLSLPVQGSE